MSWFSRIARKLARPGLALALIFAAGRPAAVRAQGGGLQYVVVEGDTIFQIALSFGISQAALLAANPDVDPAALSIGETLTIPGYEGFAGSLATRPLEAGESLDSLTLRQGLSRATLVQLNRIVNPGALYVGQPIVLLNEGDAGPPVATGTTHAVNSRLGLLGLAAATGQNPWALAAVNHLSDPGQPPPGGRLVVPGGEQATRALPHPIRDLRLGPWPPIQGRTLEVQVDTAEPAALGGQFMDRPLHFAADAGNAAAQFALQGIYRLADPDLYMLTIVVTGTDGVPVGFSQRVPVRAGDYAIDNPLAVDPATLDPAVTVPEAQQVAAMVEPVTPVRHWNGVFVLPSVGAFRSRFGSLRSYNGGPYDSFHGGVDFAGGETQAITAPAPGVVVFTGLLAVRGNATLIDHGWGVFSGYWHQSSLLVQAGDRVETGQVIGYNGDTGRVTGPHLHWELWVGGVQVNPLQWTDTVFP